MMTFDGFNELMDRAAERRRLLNAETRTDGELAAHVGGLLDEALNAIWSGASDEDVQRAAAAYGEAAAHPSISRLYRHAGAIDPGDFVVARGLTEDGKTETILGVVEEIDYEQRNDFRPDEDAEDADDYGYTFAIRELATVAGPAPGDDDQVRVWVLETGSPNVLRLPEPTRKNNT